MNAKVIPFVFFSPKPAEMIYSNFNKINHKYDNKFIHKIKFIFIYNIREWFKITIQNDLFKKSYF
jgi:hypothetical protein